MWTQLLPADVVVVEATAAMWLSPPTAREAQCMVNAVPARRREFQAGRAAARAALDTLGIRGFDLVPGIHREPVWPDAIVGSITHSAQYCAAAAARKTHVTSLGIDLVTEEDLAAELVVTVCAQEERAGLLRIPGHDPGYWAKLIFSAKEAFFKAYFPHTRAFVDFRDVAVALHPSRGAFDVELLNRDLPPLFGNRRFLGRYGSKDGLIYTALSTIA